jgi:hypothetical protein
LINYHKIKIKSEHKNHKYKIFQDEKVIHLLKMLMEETIKTHGLNYTNNGLEEIIFHGPGLSTNLVSKK